MWTKQVVGSEPQGAAVAALAFGKQIQGRADTERGEDVRGNLQTELTPDNPGLLVARKVDLAAHDHRDELVGRGEPLFLDADRIGRILIAGNAARALEVAEGGAAARIDEALDRGVGMRWRVMDLRDVVHCRDAIIELA